ncbi:hypothetical protein AC1031_022127 [Aphanomyces cochlioides]|nr:hypothetical protein AC1031_022127 [Aphanomyces cochlioides]
MGISIACVNTTGIKPTRSRRSTRQNDGTSCGCSAFNFDKRSPSRPNPATKSTLRSEKTLRLATKYMEKILECHQQQQHQQQGQESQGQVLLVFGGSFSSLVQYWHRRMTTSNALVITLEIRLNDGHQAREICISHPSNVIPRHHHRLTFTLRRCC